MRREATDALRALIAIRFALVGRWTGFNARAEKRWIEYVGIAPPFMCGRLRRTPGRVVGRADDSASSLRRIPIDVYRTPDERFRKLPGYAFEPHYLEQDGLRMHYVDEGTGAPVLLLHGEPTWAYLYRKVITGLTPVARCIAPDYFGFGRSDKPTDGGWYTYDGHVASIAALVDDLDLTDITLVVQDWGGPIGFRFAVEHPERVARLVVLNTGIGARAPGEEWLRFQAFMRRVGNEIVAGQLVRLSLVQPTSDEVIAAYDAPFPVPESRAGIVRFPELVATSADHPSAAAMLDVRERLRELRPPRTRPLLGQRPDLRPQRRRGDGRSACECGARPTPRGRGSLPAGGPRRADRSPNRRLARRPGRLDHSGARSLRRGGCARRLGELAEDVRDVAVNRVVAEHERLRDLAIAHPGGHKPQHLGFARRER